MNFRKILFISLAMTGIFATSVSATELAQDSLQVKKEDSPLISNVNFRFMLRSDVKGSFEDGNNEFNFMNKPAMVAVGFDMGEKFSFYTRYRFDFPTTIQSDGTPVSLLMFNLKYHANKNLNFTVGKQMMMHGTYEFDYCPIDVFYYSLMGDYIQGFVTGVTADYTVKGQQMVMQISKPVDSEFLWDNSKNGLNLTFRYWGNLFNGFYKPLWSYTYTNAGDGKSLNNFMIGNQFNINRLKLEVDLMKQNTFRYYESGNEGNVQKKTNEYSLVGFAEYRLPGDRFLLGAKYAYDKRELADNDDKVMDGHTISAQVRYRMSKTYGITLHAAAAHRIYDTPEAYRNSFNDGTKDMFSVGAVWDFTYKKK